MTAELFLNCFLACMFAFVVFGVLAWQIGSFFIRRWMAKELPGIIAKTLHGQHGGMEDPAAVAAIEEILRKTKGEP